MTASFYAALLALLYIVLSAHVIKGRFKFRVGLGDGGHGEMLQRIRMHANFAEYAPFALLLLFMVDFYRYPAPVIHALGILLLTGRILHAVAIKKSANGSNLRVAGMVMTLLTIAVCALLILWRYMLMALTAAL